MVNGLLRPSSQRRKINSMQNDLSSKVLKILSDAYLFFRSHFKQVAALCLPFLFAATLVNFLLARNYQDAPMALFGPLMVNLLVYPLYTAALIHLMARRVLQERPKNGDLLIAAIRQWVPLLLLKTMLLLVIGLGFSLLVLPGIWLAVRLAYAEFHVVLSGRRPMDAVRASFVETRPHFFLILILLFATYVPITLLGMASDQLIQTVTTNDLFRVIGSTGWSFAGLYVTIVLFRAFTETVEVPGPAYPPGPREDER